MGVSLIEALAQVELEAGRVYRCSVKGQWVELRLVGTAEGRPALVDDESQDMLDPWVELPQPAPLFSVIGKLGTMPLPAVPEIPDDGHGA